MPATETAVSIAALAVEVELKEAMSAVPGQPPVPVPPDQLVQVDQSPSPPPLVQVAVAAIVNLAQTKRDKERMTKNRVE